MIGSSHLGRIGECGCASARCFAARRSRNWIAAPALDRFHIDSALNGRSDDQGLYEIAHLPAGDYHLVYDVWRAQRYLPAEARAIVQETSAPGVVHVPRGERVTAADFVLPASLVLSEVRGVVLTPAGTAAAGAKVHIRPDPRDGYVFSSVVADERGRFLMTVPAGRYQLIADGYEKGEYASTAELRGVDAGAGAKELTLQLKPLK